MHIVSADIWQCSELLQQLQQQGYSYDNCQLLLGTTSWQFQSTVTTLRTLWNALIFPNSLCHFLSSCSYPCHI